jgi:hypothetical protein
VRLARNERFVGWSEEEKRLFHEWKGERADEGCSGPASERVRSEG